MDKKLEPKIGEVFTFHGKTLKCVRDTEERGNCRSCALFHGMRCIEIACCSEGRADSTHVHFVRV